MVSLMSSAYSLQGGVERDLAPLSRNLGPFKNISSLTNQVLPQLLLRDLADGLV